jgi:Deoxyribonuclease NucA/NucB
VLTYATTGNSHLDEVIRKRKRRAECGDEPPLGFGGTCDEYPFASTAEGGAGASTMGVDAVQNRSQGGYLSGFYERAKLKDGYQFYVYVINNTVLGGRASWRSADDAVTTNDFIEVLRRLFERGGRSPR